MAQATLIRLGIAHYVVTTNLDGIYRKTGLKAHTQLCCLHGDVYVERCTGCGYDFERNYHVRQDHVHVHDHKAGICERCGSAPPSHYKGTPGKLEMKKSKWGGRMVGTRDTNCGTKDTHINFGEFLDGVDWNEADTHCGKAELCIIAGTSMSLRHITHFPFMAKKVVLINLQPTPDDDNPTIRIWAKCDPVFEGLMQRLKIPIDPLPVWKPQDAVPIDKIPSWVDSYYVEKAMTLDKFYKQYEKDLIEDMKKLDIKSAVSPIKTLPDKIIIGNTHETIQAKDQGQNSHQWKIYVKGADDDNLESYIDFVKFKLHPTFSPPTVKVNQAPFTLQRIGWGTFSIKVFIYWKPQFNAPTLKHDHHLSFSEPDTFTVINLPQ
jgi:NAD-dependent SIR2 family protein deacetylase